MAIVIYYPINKVFIIILYFCSSTNIFLYISNFLDQFPPIFSSPLSVLFTDKLYFYSPFMASLVADWMGGWIGPQTAKRLDYLGHPTDEL